MSNYKAFMFWIVLAGIWSMLMVISIRLGQLVILFGGTSSLFGGGVVQ